MARRISLEEFEERIERVFGKGRYAVIEYSAISKPCVVICLRCGKKHTIRNGNTLLSESGCCSTETKFESIKRRLKDSKDYTFVKQVSKDYLIIRHEICGLEQKRTIASTFKQIESCLYCNTHKTRNMLTIEEVREQLADQFEGRIQILEYNGQLKINKYKCRQCGLIFTQQHTCLLQSRGCPKCDRNRSKGEQKIAQLLTQEGLRFKQQVRFSEIALYSFDFGIYDENDNLLYLIECQGDQHYTERNHYFESLETTQGRDQRKRDFCKEKDIPLYEIEYIKGKLLNLDILPFSSTTICE